MQVWHKPTDPAVQELRAKLEQHSGMKGLELVSSAHHNHLSALLVCYPLVQWLGPVDLPSVHN